MRIWCCLSSLLVVSVLWAQEPVAPPKPPADQTEAVKKLIEKLNAADNIAREDAERELMRIGNSALPLLKEAAKSTEPEIAARAKRLVSKMAELVSKPAKSYAETLPADSLFFVEASNAPQTIAKLKASPLGKLWELPASKKFFKAHRDGQLPSDQRLLDTIGEIGKLIEGRALMYIGPADTADMAELDPPVVYLLETKESQQMEGHVRALFDSLQDAPKSNRRYGPFTIEEHITAQTVFGQESVVHALTQKSVESYLDNRLKKPEQTLDPKLAEIRALLPNHDLLLHAARLDFQTLSDAAQIVDDDMIKGLNTYGLLEGTVLQAAISINESGFEEIVRLKVPDVALPPKNAENEPKKDEPKDPKAEKRPTLMALLKGMQPVAPEAGKPAALDLVPWQSGLLVSFNGDVSKNAMALGQALRDIDALRAPPPAKHPERKPVTQETMPAPAPAPAPAEGEKGPDAKAPDAANQPANAPAPNTPGRQALAEGAGPAPADPKPPIAEPKPAAPPPPSHPT
ncbi:MAG TPA: hypothetical protein VEJ63_19825, partial [Planctomycetota bacterium]|nr:hypothetical protein [Planctomycetota bacterium]